MKPGQDGKSIHVRAESWRTSAGAQTPRGTLEGLQSWAYSSFHTVQTEEPEKAGRSYKKEKSLLRNITKKMINNQGQS